MTLDEYRHHVKRLEDDVWRCNFLYSLSSSDRRKKELDRAKQRLARAQKYLRKFEKKEFAA